ncbi:transcription initiation factor TFIID 23-30kDa subunit-domain-containing protein [Limtongia smithiae]|uniref:transcription initiation factor TFIID 23-30kDa subunit-domain-containing protein n=1 Tax=Limtongia smithiae TaxID=1125753 RepID=UPI0034CE3A94
MVSTSPTTELAATSPMEIDPEDHSSVPPAETVTMEEGHEQDNDDFTGISAKESTDDTKQPDDVHTQEGEVAGDGAMYNDIDEDMAGLNDEEDVFEDIDAAGLEIPVDSGVATGVQNLGARRDKTLKEFLGMMEEFAPIIPDAVTDYYLMKAGFESSDIRIKRLLALATQKFIADIATDAYQYSRIRSAWSASSTNANPSAAPGQFRPGGMAPPRPAASGGSGNAAGASGTASGSGATAPSGGGGGGGGGSGGGSSSGKVVLTMDDLASALSEYGVNVHRPEFYR